MKIVNTHNNFLACYGGRTLDFNVKKLGKKWFDSITPKTDALLIHEFGHESSKNHLSDEYYDALCELGAKLKVLALEKPEELRKFGEK